MVNTIMSSCCDSLIMCKKCGLCSMQDEAQYIGAIKFICFSTKNKSLCALEPLCKFCCKPLSYFLMELGMGLLQGWASFTIALVGS